MRVTAAKDGVLIRRRLRIFAAAVALVLLCAVCVGGVSGAETVTTWEELDSAISETPVGGSVEIIIGTASSGDIQIDINSNARQINIKGKSVTISNYHGVDVVFMKSGEYNDLNIFEIGSVTENGQSHPGSLTLTGINPGSITLNRDGELGDLLQPYGTGVDIQNGGTFIMNGDVTIRNQRVYDSDEAAGVHVKAGGTFIMNGGKISGNRATTVFGGTAQSGGVYIESGASFSMSGAADISGNYVQFILSVWGSENNFGGAGQYYTICFDQNDGSGSKYYQLIHRNTNTPLTENTYDCEGHIFKCWATEESGSGTTYTDGATVRNLASAGHTKTLYAQWTKESYTLSFNTNGGIPEIIASITATYGEPINVPDVTKIGYTFEGWVDDKGNLFTSLETMPDCGNNGATKHLTAQWIEESYTLEFDTDGGIPVIDPITALFGKPIEIPEITKVGYTFDGWLDEEGNPFTSLETMPDCGDNGATKKLTAQWIKESYTLEFDTNGGIPIIDSITASYGDSIYVPVVTKIGCKFTGWLDDEGNLFTSLDTMPDCGDNGATKRITAQWLSTVQYTISIPEIITVNTDDQSAKISANIVSLPEGVNLNVVLSEKTTLNHVDLPSYGLEYVLYADGESVDNNNSVAEFSLSNTASVTLTAKLAEGVNPKYSGTYIDTVKFTVLVDETGNT